LVWNNQRLWVSRNWMKSFMIFNFYNILFNVMIQLTNIKRLIFRNRKKNTCKYNNLLLFNILYNLHERLPLSTLSQPAKQSPPAQNIDLGKWTFEEQHLSRATKILCNRLMLLYRSYTVFYHAVSICTSRMDSSTTVNQDKL